MKLRTLLFTTLISFLSILLSWGEDKECVERTLLQVIRGGDLIGFPRSATTSAAVHRSKISHPYLCCALFNMIEKGAYEGREYHESTESALYSLAWLSLYSRGRIPASVLGRMRAYALGVEQSEKHNPPSRDLLAAYRVYSAFVDPSDFSFFETRLREEFWHPTYTLQAKAVRKALELQQSGQEDESEPIDMTDPRALVLQSMFETGDNALDTRMESLSNEMNWSNDEAMIEGHRLWRHNKSVRQTLDQNLINQNPPPSWETVQQRLSISDSEAAYLKQLAVEGWTASELEGYSGQTVSELVSLNKGTADLAHGKSASSSPTSESSVMKWAPWLVLFPIAVCVFFFIKRHGNKAKR